MTPHNPRGKKKLQTNTLSDFPSLIPKSSSAAPGYLSPRSQYEEIQKDELTALAAIYGDDFRHLPSTHGAWNKSEPCFEIDIKSSDEDLAVTLKVTLTASYPKSPPLLSFKDDDTLKEGTRFKLQKVIETKPKELVANEQAMIMEIVEACLEVLKDAAAVKSAGREIPSLEEERAAYKAAALKQAQEEKELAERKKRLETLEEERVQETLLQVEMDRQRTKAREIKRLNRPSPSPSLPIHSTTGLIDAFSFEQPITILDGDGNLHLFQSVDSKFPIRQGPISKCFTVRPVTSRGSSNLPLLVLKQTEINTNIKDMNFKAKLQLLESDLRSLKSIKHQNILEILSFEVHITVEKYEEIESSWNVSILLEYAEKGSLQEFIDIAGYVGVEKVRSWTIELLDALQFLHEKGIVHQAINLGNILLVRSFNGEVHPKLADASYQKRLHDLCGKKHDVFQAKPTNWIPPEISNNDHPKLTQKTDIWDFGILFLQMIFGSAVIQTYTSPTNLVESLPLSVSMNEFVLKLFKLNPSRRPRAVELTPSEFLATDAPVLESFSTTSLPLGSIPSQSLNISLRNRHDLIGGAPLQRSRYREDFVGEGRIGKGGFGEVVKARKKLDGKIYAIKKITQKSSASLTEILKEVRLLSLLSHPSVVRSKNNSTKYQYKLHEKNKSKKVLGYYNTWTEEVSDDSDTDESDTDGTSNSDDSLSKFSHETVSCIKPDISFCVSTGGLDFMSSSRYSTKNGYEDTSDEEGVEDDEEDDDDDDDDDGSTYSRELHYTTDKTERTDLLIHNTSSLKTEASFKRPKKIALYISMEYCEKQTLRDLIKREIHKDNQEIWRLFRQILEGLVHIHGLNIVHRDLKPENIFIDAASNVKIGDFGLATSGQGTVTEKTSPAQLPPSGDMTQGVGTAFYVAPEVNSSVKGTYTSKVDMYSLGMIFFEMCFRPLIPGMDRARVGESLRKNPAEFPTEFKVLEKPIQVDIILSLLSHCAKDRPSSSELLKSGKLPLQMENETIQRALLSLADPKSPYYEKMMETLFSLQNDRARDYAWDTGSISHVSCDLLLLRGLVKQELIKIFRHHGAVETTRTAIFPRSNYYGPNVVELLDERGTVLQLPYDLTLPHARDIAKHQPVVERSFAFGRVFRDRDTGGQPQSLGEVDFDIVSSNKLDFPLKEAEVIKVLDEISESFPSLSTNQMCFQINHSDLLGYVFDFCQIEPQKRRAVADTLSKLNIQSWTWQKIQLELRSPHIGLSAPSIADLQRFDFRDTVDKAIQKLTDLFKGSDIFQKASPAIAHLRDVIEYAKRFEVKKKIFITPLGSLNEKFFRGGMFFSCVLDRRPKDVFAIGGRYDSLIQDCSRKLGSQKFNSYAVGFNFAWEKIARRPKVKSKGFIKKIEEENDDVWDTKRCDVLVASHDATILRTEGINLLKTLWSHSISAELAQDSHSPEDLLSKCREDQHSWIVIIKQDSILKVKSINRREINDVDIPSSQLLSYLKSEIRERDRRVGAHQREKSKRTLSTSAGNEQDVRILASGTKFRKLNRRNIVEQAQSHAAALTQEMLEGPIFAIETTDQVMEILRKTRIGEHETWRNASNAVSAAEKIYLTELHELMLKIKEQKSDGTRNAFIYNFRTGTCVYYDLGE
ncbi:eIF-2-alpha kinase [Podosphaera aphanis]|nr:eIF-2-alpha kinase [Podosphaera aphanis]